MNKIKLTVFFMLFLCFQGFAQKSRFNTATGTEQIKMEKINEQNIKANISKLNPGLYFVQGQLADGSIKTERFFKID